MINQYPKATLEEYGYKDRKQLKQVLHVFGNVVVILTVIMMYISIFTLAVQSFNSSTDITRFESFTLKWYVNMFSNRMLRSAIINTFIVSITATLIATVLGTFIAIGINAFEKKKRQSLMLLNNIPVLNADIITGISLMLVFSMVLPIFPYFFGPFTMILAHLFFTLPYVVLSVLPKLKEIDKFLMDAALDLGVKPYRALIKIVIPAVKAGIFSGMLLAFTMSLDDFVISYYTTGNGFNNLSIWVYGSIGRRSLTPSVYAYSTALTVITLGLLLGNHFYQQRRAKHHG